MKITLTCGLAAALVALAACASDETAPYAPPAPPDHHERDGSTRDRDAGDGGDGDEPDMNVDPGTSLLDPDEVYSLRVLQNVQVLVGSGADETFDISAKIGAVHTPESATIHKDGEMIYSLADGTVKRFTADALHKENGAWVDIPDAEEDDPEVEAPCPRDSDTISHSFTLFHRPDTGALAFACNDDQWRFEDGSALITPPNYELLAVGYEGYELSASRSPSLPQAHGGTLFIRGPDGSEVTADVGTYLYFAAARADETGFWLATYASDGIAPSIFQSPVLRHIAFDGTVEMHDFPPMEADMVVPHRECGLSGDATLYCIGRLGTGFGGQRVFVRYHVDEEPEIVWRAEDDSQLVFDMATSDHDRVRSFISGL